MQKIWNIKTRTQIKLLDQLLENKGIDTEHAQAFLEPDYTDLYDPFLFKDMRSACQRILDAISRKQKIFIYSDYDADAITANALLFRALKSLGAQPEIYIPDRFAEGYGLNLEAFAKIKERGGEIVITVDCGTNSVAEADFCAQNRIDLIITDHHELTGDLPKAAALLNPKAPGETYPYTELTGVGVAFKLVCGLYALAGNIKRYPDQMSLTIPAGFEKWYLDLVAIGTVADCHSLLGENRGLVKFGLQVLAKTKWPGLRAIMNLAGLAADGSRLDTYALGFIIAPRINAAGRIEHAAAAFDVLIEDDPDKAARLAENLQRLNQRRQMLTETVMSEARSQLLPYIDNKILLAYGDDWPKGVVGLVAGKLSEEFFKPVLVLDRQAEFATGSARSIKNFNILKALSSAKDYLVKYGGHAAAAGFTLRSQDIDIFYKRLLDFADTNLQQQDLVKAIDIDAELAAHEINLQTLRDIEKLAPFGVDNIKPKFVLRSAEISAARSVGKEQKHLQMQLSVGSAPGLSTAAAPEQSIASARPAIFKCIAFNLAKANLAVGDVIDIVFEILEDNWNGYAGLKLKIVDYIKSGN